MQNISEKRCSGEYWVRELYLKEVQNQVLLNRQTTILNPVDKR